MQKEDNILNRSSTNLVRSLSGSRSRTMPQASEQEQAHGFPSKPSVRLIIHCIGCLCNKAVMSILGPVQVIFEIRECLVERLCVNCRCPKIICAVTETILKRLSDLVDIL
jgi:hypothetical protein